MTRNEISFAFVFLLACMVTLPQAAHAAAGAEQQVSVTITARRNGADAPSKLVADDFVVYQNKQRRNVVSLEPAGQGKADLDLAILIDDSLSPSIANQFGGLKKFINGLPQQSRVAVAYASHGSAQFTQKFTDDHSKAASSLRLPVGGANQVSSIYMALDDLLKNWPERKARGAVLLLSDGLDVYRGFAESMPTQNPDLARAIEAAQRHNINIFSIFANQAGRFGRSAFLLDNGQSSLVYLSHATGGKAFFQGLETPVDMAPFLKQIGQLLSDQYLLTFRAQTEISPGFDRLRVTTEQPGVTLLAPTEVFVPGSGASTSTATKPSVSRRVGPSQQ